MPAIGLLVFPGFQCLALGAQTAFELANKATDEEFYSFHLLSLEGGLIPSSSGFRIETQPVADQTRLDTLLFLAGGQPTDPLSPATIAALQTQARRARRIVGICTGAFLLAQCGLLDGKRATTHWRYAQLLRDRFPTIKVEADRIYINEGRIWTSAGLTAGLDLSVALVEKDLGQEVARMVARRLVMHHRRAGGQSQYSELLALSAKSDRIQTALIFAKNNLAQPLTVESLAEAAHLSPRQFSRAFRAETGQTPARAVEQLRLEAARIMLEETRHPVEVVAQETGFKDQRRMRESFQRQWGLPPQAIRRTARDTGVMA